MLFNEVVQQDCNKAGVCTDRPNTWVTSKQFYAGLGIVQVGGLSAKCWVA